MDSPWTWALIFLAIVALMTSSRVPRAWRWIGVGGLSFIISTLFQDYSSRTDLQPFVTLGCDALVCLAIYRWHRETWEIPLYIAFMCSVFASLIFIGFKFEHWVYASLLELCNLGALICITGTGLIDMIGRNEHRHTVHNWRGHLFHAHRSARGDDKASGR